MRTVSFTKKDFIPFPWRKGISFAITGCLSIRTVIATVLMTLVHFFVFKNSTGVTAIIILVEDWCQPNLIKAVKKVMRLNMRVLVGCCYVWLRALADKLSLI